MSRPKFDENGNKIPRWLRKRQRVVQTRPPKVKKEEGETFIIIDRYRPLILRQSS